MFALRNRLEILGLADLLALSAPIGLLLGRVANFINAELWGARPPSLGVVFPGEAAQSCTGAIGLCARHPSQIYEAALEGLVLGAVLLTLALRRKWLHSPGALTGMFLAGYGSARFLVEFVRQPDMQFVTEENPIGHALHFGTGGLTMGQILSLPHDPDRSRSDLVGPIGPGQPEAEKTCRNGLILPPREPPRLSHRLEKTMSNKTDHHHDHQHHDADPEGQPGSVSTAVDPVCGMSVEVTQDTLSKDLEGETYYFCSDRCLTQFKTDPWLYAFSGGADGRMHEGAPGASTTPVAPGTKWTCPMHPEIIRDEPGSCPICGMALETVLPSEEQNEELTDFTRRMWISSAAAVPLVILTMGELVGLPVRDWVGHQLATYVEFLIATPIILWAAQPFFARGVESIRNRSPNMWTLIALGVGAAYVYSLFATFLPNLFPDQYRTKGGSAPTTRPLLSSSRLFLSVRSWNFARANAPGMRSVLCSIWHQNGRGSFCPMDWSGMCLLSRSLSEICCGFGCPSSEFWARLRPDLREDLAHLVCLIMRRICGEASVAFRWSSV